LKNQSVIVAPAGKFQIPIVYELKKIGVSVICIDEKYDAEAMEFADLRIALPLNRTEDIFEQIAKSDLMPIGGISYCSDAGAELISLLSLKFGFHATAIEVIKSLTDKYLQRISWQDTGIPIPKWRLCKSLEEFISSTSELDGELVVKPTDSSGSRGVSFTDYYDPLKLKKYAIARNFSRQGLVLTETKLEGIEYTVDIFLESNSTIPLCVTKKEKGMKELSTVSNLLETMDLNSSLTQELIKTVTSAARNLNYNEGPVHAEIFAKDEEITGVVEIAGRGGASNLASRLVEVHSGINYPSATCDFIFRRPFKETHHSNKPALMYFIPTANGILKEISFDKRRVLAGDIEVNLYKKNGELLTDPTSDGDRLGDVIVSSESHDKNREVLKEFLTSLVVVFEND